MDGGSDVAFFGDLPDELVVQVFSYLNPSQLGKCSRVCKRWRRLCREPKLWRQVYATMWWLGQWNYSACVGNAYQITEYDYYLQLLDPIRGLPSDENYLNIEQSWVSFYSGLERSLLDHNLGAGVRVLEISANYYLDDCQFNTLISACPNMEELYANYTHISSGAFQTPNSSDCLKKLRILALSGCTAITDRTVRNLVACWNTGGKSVGLRSLSLSGCFRLTDDTLRVLSTCTVLLAGLEFLDLSGCSFGNGQLLRTFVHGCTQLEPKNLFYCCNIVTGPYQTSANGCNNLDSVSRACCVQYQN